MATPFKVLIIGGGVAGLSLALMLEAYGFDYELLEKHSDVAPKLGAGVGLTPNGARILDQIGVWRLMCEHGSAVTAGTALSPEGRTVIYNPNMGEWLEKLFGYKIHFLSRHDCLRILYNKIKHKSNLHLLKEVVKIESLRGKTQVETQDGSIYTGDIIVGADGVRSNVRRELWRIADSEVPGYIPKRDKAGIVSFYTAVVGIAHNPGLSAGGSVRAYNEQRSYFFQEGREGSGEFYWWLCSKNEKTKEGIIPKLASEAKQALLDKYAADQIGPNLTLGDLYKNSIYSAIIPLQEFVLEKCFYKNILLIGDSFRKLHPVAGQGANSAIEESAYLADILCDLRKTGALKSPARIEQEFSKFQKERYVRLTALREDANLVQRMESFDNPVLKFMALHVIPRLPFVVAFLPQLGASFTPGRCLKYLAPPKSGLCPFLPDIKATPTPRPVLATLSWASLLFFAASLPWWISTYLPGKIDDITSTDGPLARVLQLYASVIAVSASELLVIESFKPAFLVSPLTSASPWIQAANYWGWERILPVYLCLHIALSQSVAYYHIPQTMTDLGVAKTLLPTLILVYAVPVLQTLIDPHGFTGNSWKIAHSVLPLVAVVNGKIFKAIKPVPKDIDVVFSNVDMPYQRRFQMTVVLVASALHVYLASIYGSTLVSEGWSLLGLPIVRTLVPLITVTTSWCLYMPWELRRINAVDIPVFQAWAIVILSTLFCGPAATLAGTWNWSSTQLAMATSFQNPSKPLTKPVKKGGRKGMLDVAELYE